MRMQQLIDADARSTMSTAKGLFMGHQKYVEGQEADQLEAAAMSSWEGKAAPPLKFPLVWAAPLRTQSGEGMRMTGTAFDCMCAYMQSDRGSGPGAWVLLRGLLRSGCDSP